MEKKVTVKDVAKAAGVSVATVSYIMNDRTDQKISPETRKKVLQIANLMNYHPSHAAKSLATGRNNIIGVAYTLNELTPSRNIEITTFINLLIERFNRLKYDVLFLPLPDEEDNPTTFINRNIDAIIAIDLKHELFRRLADNYLVPVIGVDMLIQDDLFYQIYTDYPSLIDRIISERDSYLLLDSFSNKNYQDYITNSFEPERVLCYSDITVERLHSLNNSSVIIIGVPLALIALPYLNPAKVTVIASGQNHILLPETVRIISSDLSKKANLTINILLNALDRNFELNHDVKVL